MAVASDVALVDEDAAQPFSVMWWLDQLEDALVDRIPKIDKCEQYYAGKHNLEFATPKFKEAFGRLFREFSDNWCELVTDSSVERLTVQGFRYDKEDASGDTDAWDMWQANGLDSESVIAHTMSCKTGWSYAMVGPGEGFPEITIEHPCEVIVATAPGGRRTRQAALKRWDDELGYRNWYVYMPDAVHKFSSSGPIANSGIDPVPRWFESVRNPLGVVPIIPIANDPDGRGYGTSDIAQVIPTQDAVNKLIADMMVSAEFNAFPQRHLTGVALEADESTQKMVNDLMSGASRVWSSDSPDARFGAFPESTLSGFVSGIELLIQHIAARTRTPPHYLLGQSGNFPSGDSLKATETGLVAKVRKKQLFFGEAWEEIMRLGFLLQGDTKRGSEMGSETLWRDPESRSQGELVDSLVKMATIGVPEEALWQRYGASPQEIARWQEMQAAQAARMPAQNAAVPLTGLPSDPAGAAAQVGP